MHTLIQKTLDILTRLLHVDVRYFARGGAWLAGGQFFMSGMAMISAIAFANLLPEETFGHYRFVLSLVGILSIASLSGMDTALIRAASRGYERTLVPILKRKILFGLIGMVVTLATSLYYALNDNTLLAGALLFCAFCIPFKEPLKLYDALLSARKQFSTLTMYRVATQAVSLTALIVTMLVSDSLLPVLVAYFLPVMCVELILLVHTLRTTPLSGTIDTTAIRYGYHLSFLQNILRVTYNIQTVMLFHFLGPVSVALFYFAQAPTEQARTLVLHVRTLLLPKTAKDTWHVGTLVAFSRKLAPFLGIIALGTCAYILLAPILFSVFFPTYTQAVLYSQLYAPTILLIACNTVTQSIIMSKGSIRTQYVLVVIDIILQLIVVIPLLYMHGIYGLIVGAYITKSVVGALLFARLFLYPRVFNR